MKWEGLRRSSNVEDRRGMGMGRIGLAGGGIGTVVIVVLAMLFGVDPGVLLDQGPTANSVQQQPPNAGTPAQDDPMKEFVSAVLADTEDTWKALFDKSGRTYQEPTLVLFSGAVQSACGMAQTAVGPFYCPADGKIYIDLSFYRDLRERFQAPGDFAQAYVIAHEVGHHVQNLLGIAEEVHTAQRRVPPERANALSVRAELQADCLAGIWAFHADRSRNLLEQGDVEEGLNAASQIGDDRMQKRAQGYAVPESFTHGSSKDRVRWFKRGLESGDINQCDTFQTGQL